MGVPNYESALQSFKQGEGMIDLVNTYIVIMINSGVIGLVLFLFPYALVVGKMLGARSKDRMVSKAVLGKFTPAFIAMILAMLFTIFTASTLDVMQYLLALGITLPVVWLTQVRQEITVAEEPEPAHGVRHASVPGYGDNPGMLQR
jgi:predicted MFS family arabinose efflux permease